MLLPYIIFSFVPTVSRDQFVWKLDNFSFIEDNNLLSVRRYSAYSLLSGPPRT
jgi:hypothetical protein